ncbi:hypothetical protein TRIUR3_00932 [Triticum urartu]|uniref:Uncharacterized protein n=1 Tax=Triticum urartu TaxID=4572 RepID=M7Y6F3_TRIUA|nr:hypothetical protein TRIUR3_00932 [Triticum urartu]
MALQQRVDDEVSMLCLPKKSRKIASLSTPAWHVDDARRSRFSHVRCRFFFLRCDVVVQLDGVEQCSLLGVDRRCSAGRLGVDGQAARLHLPTMVDEAAGRTEVARVIEVIDIDRVDVDRSVWA